MITLSMVSLLVGAMLEHRFNVFALVPTTVIALVLAFGIGVAHADTAWSIVLMAATAAMSVQIGYLVGMGVRHVLAAALTSRSPVNPTASTSARHPAR